MLNFTKYKNCQGLKKEHDLIKEHYFCTMNFLAHLYLSGTNNDLRFGNFIADAIRASQYTQYPQGIQEGIRLHRSIDSFTDAHPIFRQHCKLFFPQHSHYARVILDVVYDHFLAQLWEEYHTTKLVDYAADFYRITEENKADLPDKMQRLFELMKKQNWLVEYGSIKGLERILYHMSKRTSFPSNFPAAIGVVEANKDQMVSEFKIFFSELEKHCKNHIELQA